MRKLLLGGAIALGLLGGLPMAAAAQAGSIAADAHTGYLLLCAALLLLMTPSVALFCGGFGRSQTVLNTLLMSVVLLAIVSVTWILWGYSLTFAPGNPLIGGMQWLFLADVGYETSGYLRGSAPAAVDAYAPVPHQAFMIYQAMLAIFAPAVLSGAIADRMNVRAYALFVLLWSSFVYSPMVHMMWGKGGLLGQLGGMGALDFAGGTVHILAGVSALVAAWMLGARRAPASPQNVPLILLGAGLLWVSWFGLTAGHALAADTVATAAFVSTQTAVGAAVLTWILLEQTGRGNPTAVGAAIAIVTGLVTITPAAGLVTPLAALLIGSMGAVCCFAAIRFKAKLRLDDSPSVAAIFGVGGTVGMVLTGVFATTDVNAAGSDGLLFGNPTQVAVQLGAIGLACLLAIVGTFVILKILEATVGLRVDASEDAQGLDRRESGSAYNSTNSPPDQP